MPKVVGNRQIREIFLEDQLDALLHLCTFGFLSSVSDDSESLSLVDCFLDFAGFFCSSSLLLLLSEELSS